MPSLRKPLISIHTKQKYKSAQNLDTTVKIATRWKGKIYDRWRCFYLEEGETIIMPKDMPHSVYGEEKFKMLLVVSF